MTNEEVFVEKSALEELFSASQQLMVTNSVLFLYLNFSHDLGYYWGLPAGDFCRFIPRVC